MGTRLPKGYVGTKACDAQLDSTSVWEASRVVPLWSETMVNALGDRSGQY